MLADDITCRVTGVADVVASVSPHSEWGWRLAASPRWFGPDDVAAWRVEQGALAAVDAWWTEESEDAARGAFEQLPTLERPLLVLESGSALDDVALFEVKRFLYFAGALLAAAGAVIEHMDPSWSASIATLMHAIHPERKASPRFMLVSDLDPRLAAARQAHKRARRAEREARQVAEAALLADHAGKFDVHGRFVPSGSAAIADPRLRPLVGRKYELVDPQVDAAVEAHNAAADACYGVEDEVRERLSEVVRPYVPMLEAVRAALGELDRRCALVTLRRAWSGCWPTLGEHLSFEDGRHPRLIASIDADDLQPISLALDARPAIVTGPNMGGKSLLLELVGVVQWCAQHGFPVPASRATFAPMHRIAYVGSEDPSAGVAGLSSFGREVRRVVDQAGASPMLWLLDEFGRGTHPDDGSQLALELVQKRAALGDPVVAATHFPALAHMEGAAHFRIAGLSRPEVLASLGAAENLDAIEAAMRAAMDYRPLVRAPGDPAVPRDARLIATALGLDLD